MKEIIKLENVVKMYPGERRAVSDVSLAINKGQRVTIQGAPGSGKSALMRLIAGMERPSAGSIFVLEKAVHEMDEGAAAAFRNRHIGMMEREPGFIEKLSVLENTAMPLTVRGIPVFKRNREAKERLKETGLLSVINALPQQLSVFEKTLASVARMLIARPEILLLDEIFAGLLDREKERLSVFINSLGKSGNHTIIVFCAEMNNSLIMDRKIKISGGRIQEEL